MSKNKKKTSVGEAIEKAQGVGKKLTGKIKWFNIQKGFGFITAEDGNDYFIHHRGIKAGRHYVGYDTDDEVTFEIVQGKNGIQAGNVMMIPREGEDQMTEDPEETTGSEE